MASVEQVVSPFFETVHPFKLGNPKGATTGQFVWAPVPFVDHIPLVFKAERAQPDSHTEIKYEFRRLTNNDFKKVDKKLPIKGLNLNETEELLGVKAKKRLCILIAKYDLPKLSDELSESIKGKNHLYREDYFLLPIYGIQGDCHRTGFPVKFVDAVRKLQFNQFFYVPEYTPKQTQCDAFIYEGVLRLDRLFVSGVHHQTLDFVDIKLAADALKILLVQVALFLSIDYSKEDKENFLALRELLASA